MKLQIRDIELMRIIAMCKDIPVHLPFDDFLFTDDYISNILYIKKSKSGYNYRLTTEGYLLIDKLGFAYTTDKYPVGKGKSMDRRFKTAIAVLLMYRAGIHIFEHKIPYFLPSFIYRRNNTKGKLLGGSTFVGLLVTEVTTYVVFCNTEKTINMTTEIAIAKHFSLVYGTPQHFEIILITNENAIYNWKQTHNTYLVCPNDIGAKQLKLLTTRDYIKPLLEGLINNDNYIPHGYPIPADLFVADKKIPAIICPEFDITKIRGFANQLYKEEMNGAIIGLKNQPDYLHMLVDSDIPANIQSYYTNNFEAFTKLYTPPGDVYA